MCAWQSAGERSGGLVFARVRDLYPHFEYSDLVQHKAVVLIPYQARPAAPQPLVLPSPCSQH